MTYTFTAIIWELYESERRFSMPFFAIYGRGHHTGVTICDGS
jgi:hypothetical protein